MDLRLNNATRVYNELRDRLINEGLAADDQTLGDTLEGATDLHDQIARVARDARLTEANAKACGEIAKETADRKARLTARAERLRKHIAWAMDEASLPNVTAPDLTLTMRMGKPELTVTGDVNTAPERFVRIKREWDRVAVREALEAGEKLPFAALGNAAPILTVRGG